MFFGWMEDVIRACIHIQMRWGEARVKFTFLCASSRFYLPLGLVSVCWGFLVTQCTNHEQKQHVSTSCPIDVMIVEWRNRLESDLEAAACIAWCMCVCVCVFNLHNICFLRSFPAAINCWLSFVFDKRRRTRRRRWRRKGHLRNGAQASVEPNCVFSFPLFFGTFCWKISGMRHTYTVRLWSFAQGDVYLQGSKGKSSTASPGCSCSEGGTEADGEQSFAPCVGPTLGRIWSVQGLQIAHTLKVKICIAPAVSFCPAEVGSQWLCRGLHHWHPPKPFHRDPRRSSGERWPLRLTWF